MKFQSVGGNGPSKPKKPGDGGYEPMAARKKKK